MNTNLSIDIGGTKIRIIEYAADNKILQEQLLKTADFFTGKSKNLEELLGYLSKIYSSRYNRIGLSINSWIYKHAILYSSLMGGETNINVLDVASRYFSFSSFHSDNDVICMAKAENRFGIGQKSSSFLYVNVGTGIRFVAVENNNILRGYRNRAGEISKLPIWVEEFREFIEADSLLAGKGIKNIGGEIFQTVSEPSRLLQDNIKIRSVYIKNLAKMLFTVSHFYNPEYIILGGSVTKSLALFLVELKKTYLTSSYVRSCAKDILLTELLHPASLGAIL